MAYTPQQLREIYLKLPQDLRDALFDVNSSELVRTIGEKHKLTIDKIGELASETGYVMLGMTHPNQFISNLAERLEVDKAKAKEIAEDVNVQIFKKVRESLKKIHGIKDEETPKDSPLRDSQGESLGEKIESREEILKEIEKEEAPSAPKNKSEKISEKTVELPIPDILKGSTTPVEENPPAGGDEKPPIPPPSPPAAPAQKYQSGEDPYREPVG